MGSEQLDNMNESRGLSFDADKAKAAIAKQLDFINQDHQAGTDRTELLVHRDEPLFEFQKGDRPFDTQQRSIGHASSTNSLSMLNTGRVTRNAESQYNIL